MAVVEESTKVCSDDIDALVTLFCGGIGNLAIKQSDKVIS